MNAASFRRRLQYQRRQHGWTAPVLFSFYEGEEECTEVEIEEWEGHHWCIVLLGSDEVERVDINVLIGTLGRDTSLPVWCEIDRGTDLAESFNVGRVWWDGSRVVVSLYRN
ncbi:MAG: hypothetical protein HQ567_12575 [Candidatus Nealsonbacteria bacterium]|nr:hypothetical protein [Candidatus Nealsonbacteria bacterium]